MMTIKDTSEQFKVIKASEQTEVMRVMPDGTTYILGEVVGKDETLSNVLRGYLYTLPEGDVPQPVKFYLKDNTDRDYHIMFTAKGRRDLIIKNGRLLCGDEEIYKHAFFEELSDWARKMISTGVV